MIVRCLLGNIEHVGGDVLKFKISQSNLKHIPRSDWVREEPKYEKIASGKI